MTNCQGKDQIDQTRKCLTYTDYFSDCFSFLSQDIRPLFANWSNTHNHFEIVKLVKIVITLKKWKLIIMKLAETSNYSETKRNRQDFVFIWSAWPNGLTPSHCSVSDLWYLFLRSVYFLLSFPKGKNGQNVHKLIQSK